MASTHKHIRSGTANKRPTTAIADGQIALNTNLSSPGLFFKDSTGAEILKIGPVHVGATAPNASPAGSAGNSTGEIWLDTSLTPVGVKIWNGSAFVNATPIGSTTVQGLLELATDAETQAGADTARAVTSASLQSKLSDSTSTTSNTTIASSTAVKAAYDLANAALPKTGGTVTGNLEIGTAGSLSFEGATADGFETTIAVVDPTADRTITLPNTTGTVVTTGDSGTVTSTMLLDGTIVDADINASAAIAYSKLASLTSANILVGNSSNVATSTAVTGDVTISNAGVTAISAGAIVNADVNASAAIAGSKISPDFGAQNVVTTGTSTAGSFTPTSTTVPAVGVYSPGANRLGITTNTVERVEFGTSEVVFNDDAADYDFRIEGDTNSNLFFADASAEAVGIRTATPVSELNVSVGNGGNITISNTNDAHSAGLAFGDTTSNSSGRISYDHSTNALAVATNGVERLRLSSTGDLKLGTTDTGGRALISRATVPTTYSKNTAYLQVGTTEETVNGFHLITFGYTTSSNTFQPAFIGYTETSNEVNTTGALIFGTRTATSDTTPTERLRITSAGLVGIGTSSPLNTLNIVDSASVHNGTIRLGSSTYYSTITQDAVTTGKLAINSAATSGAVHGIQLQVDGTAALAINSSRQVGIGTTNPGAQNTATPLVVGNTSQNNGITILTGTNSDGVLNFNDGENTSLRGYLIYEHSSDSLRFGANGSERGRFDSSGRLLVGTSTARSNFYNSTISAQFQTEGASTDNRIISLVSSASSGSNGPGFIFGKQNSGAVGGNTVVASGDNLGNISFQGSDGTEFVEGASITAFVDGTPGANDMPGRLVFSTCPDSGSSPVERMRINNGGNVRMFAGAGQGGLALALTDNAASGQDGITLAHSATGIAGSGTISFKVIANGNVTNTNNSYGAISDAKLKENIVDANSQWNDLKALQVRKYNFKEETGHQTHTQLGLIAQEVELISPGLVTESPDRDADGNDLGTVTKSVNYSVLYMKAVKALQEAMGRIETLEQRLAAAGID